MPLPWSKLLIRKATSDINYLLVYFGCCSQLWPVQLDVTSLRVEREISHVELAGRGALSSCVVVDLPFIIDADMQLFTVEHSAMSLVDAAVNNIRLLCVSTMGNYWD